MKHRVGLVGTGYISKFHVQGLRRLANVEIVGVSDRDPARARQFGSEHGIADLPSLAALIDAGAQVIHVLTPPAAHAPLAIEALRRGCHVFIEKPIATSVEDCEAIQNAAEKAGRTVCVGHSLLYDPFVKQARDLVAAGAIGDVLGFDYFRSQNQQTYPISGLSPDQQRGGYPFRDIGIHALYLAEAFVGPILDLDAWPIATGRGDCNCWVDEWRVAARTEKGTAQIHLSWNVRPQQNLFIVQGSAGVIRADLFGLSVVTKKHRPLPEHASRVLNAVSEGSGMVAQAVANIGRIATKRVYQFHGIQALIGEFYRRLDAGEAAPVTPNDAKRALYWTEHVARQADALKAEWVAQSTAHRVGAKVLVTGGSGFIGQALVDRLVRDGCAVRLLLRRTPSASVTPHPLVEVVIGDLSDADAVNRAMDGIQVVYHLGATMRGSASEFDRGTVTGTNNVVDAAVRHGARLVYMSSLAVIDTFAGSRGLITESAALEERVLERGSYTRTKLQAEQIVLDAVKQRNLQAVLLRPGEVVGPAKPLLTSGVAQRLGRTLVVLGNGEVRLPLVHVGDVVDGLIAAEHAQLENGTIIHLVDDATVTQNDIIADYLKSTGERARVVRVPLALVILMARAAELLFRVLGRPTWIVRRIRAATEPRKFDCTRARTLLGWSARSGVLSAFSGSRGAAKVSSGEVVVNGPAAV